MPVMAEPRRDTLGGDHAAAEPLVLLEDQDLLAGLGKIGGGDEPVMTRPDNDDVVCIRQGWSSPDPLVGQNMPPDRRPFCQGT